MDGKSITAEEVVYLPLTRVSPEQEAQLKKLGNYYPVPRRGTFFSHPKEWGRLLKCAFQKDFLSDISELKVAAVVCFHF